MTRRLPIWATASAAYRHLEKHAVYAVLVIGFLTAMTVVIPFWYFDTTGTGALLIFLFIAIYAFGWLLIALSWHRRYLYPGAPRLTATQGFFVAIVYALQLFKISSLSGAIVTPMVILFVLTDELSGNVFSELARLAADRGTLINLAVVFVFLIVPYVFVRLTLVLPASTVGNDDIGIWASWKHMRGNGLRLLGAWVLAAIPPMGLAFLCLLAGSPENIRDLLILRAVIYTIAFGFVVITVLNTLSVLSIAYAVLVEKRAAPKPTLNPTRLEATGAVIRSRH